MSERSDEWRAFEKHAEDWEQYTRRPLGRLRQDLVIFHLLEHLCAYPPGLRVLDAGCGSGGYALALGQRGHHVCLVDFSQAMLDSAHEAFRKGAPLALQNAQFCCWPMEEISEHLSQASFDVVLCHTLLEYIPQPIRLLRTLLEVLAPGGILSLLLVNPDADAMNWALVKGDLGRARQSLSSEVERADLFGLTRRSLALEDVRIVLREAALTQTVEYGARIFADYFPLEKLEDDAFWTQLWSLEVEASQIEAYKGVARYTHIISVKAR